MNLILIIHKYIFFRNIRNITLDQKSYKTNEPELALIKYFAPQNKKTNKTIAIDIGANIGQYTYKFEQYFGGRNVYAFEPLAQNSKTLHSFFPDVHVISSAVSNLNGYQKIKVPIISGNPFLTRATLENYTEIGENDQIYEKVRITSLDEYLKTHHLKNISFIKIDVEGHEEKVLKGATKTLKKEHPVLLIEIEQRHHKKNILSIFQFIKNLNYSGYFFDRQKKKLRSINQFDTKTQQNMKNFKTKRYVNNFLFIPNDSPIGQSKRVSQLLRNKEITIF